MRHLSLVLVALLLSRSAIGQTYTISTFAGGGLPVNIQGTSASLDSGVPLAVAADRAGNVFFVDQSTVLRLDAVTGLLTAVAGNGTTGFSGDNGPATSAQLHLPEETEHGLAVDSAGNLYISDVLNNRIRKVSNGVITTVAGNGTGGFSGDNGPATRAQLAEPIGLAVDSAGNLYFADGGSNRVREVFNGIITTVAGNGTTGFSGDNGPATSAQLWGASYVAVDSAGNLYITDSNNQRIRKVSNGIITTVAGNGTFGFSGDGGPATSAQIATPSGIGVDAAGNLYIADALNNRIRKVSGGVISTVAGNGIEGANGDNGPAIAASLGEPFGVALDSAANLYIADLGNGRIRKVSNETITTVAGNGTQGFSGDSGPATDAQLNSPNEVAMDSAGNLYIADWLNNRIRKVSNGVITTVAGDGTQGFSGDNGQAISAQLSGPKGISVDSAGNLYIADTFNYRIRKISKGIITTFAGNGIYGFSGDNGPATSANLAFPSGLALDSAANLYIGDTGNNRIRKVSNGIISTVAGDGTAGFSGDNGAATGAELNEPFGITLDTAGNLYIADVQNQRIRKVSNGIITTVAGNGIPTFSGDNGPAASAGVAIPSGVAVDSAGNLFIAETLDCRIRKIVSGVITTVAGNGPEGFDGDNGPATSAQLFQPNGLAVDSAGNVYVADTLNNRIRLLAPLGSPAINPGGILNAASSAVGAPVAPGSIATDYGNFLVTSLSTAASAPLPTKLDGLSLQFGGSLDAPLFAVSGGQINFQVPWELAGQSQAALSAAINGETSATQTLNLATYAPGLFSMNGQGTGQGAILDTSYNLVNSSNPATAGVTVLQIYCTGLGPVNNQPASGAAASDAQLSKTTAIPTVTVGGVSATVLFSGLAPGSVGEYQVDALVPAGSSKGGSVPVVISIGGVVSNAVFIAVQ